MNELVVEFCSMLRQMLFGVCSLHLPGSTIANIVVSSLRESLIAELMWMCCLAVPCTLGALKMAVLLRVTCPSP